MDRQGISKVRHIGVDSLRLQEHAAKKLGPSAKIPEEVNTADFITKHLGNAEILKHLPNLHVVRKTG